MLDKALNRLLKNKVMNQNELCKRLGISRMTLHRMLHDKYLPCLAICAKARPLLGLSWAQLGKMIDKEVGKK